MAKSSTGDRIEDSSNQPVLLFDAKCGVCNRLAHNVQKRTNTPVGLLALSDPAAQSLLDEHYTGGWSHDFYLIDGNVARRGVRALPKIASIVGVRNFSALVSEYGQYLARSGDCGGCGENHIEVHEEAADPLMGGSTRRTFAKLLGGAAGSALIPLSGVVSADSNPTSTVRDTIPNNLHVHVARVRPNEEGFAMAIETDQSLIRRDVWNDGPATERESDIEVDEVSQRQLIDTKTDSMERVDLTIHDPDPTTAQAQALRQSGATDSAVGAMRRYEFQLDQPRHTLNLNTGSGPVVVDDTPGVAGSLSGEISHDLADPLVDFITLETKDEASLETHMNAYVEGLKAYRQHYSSQGARKLADTYATLAHELGAAKDAFVSSVDGDIAPLTNTLGISSLPSWTHYVESPTPSSGSRQDVTVHGTSCGCNCCLGGCIPSCGCRCCYCL